MYNTSTNLPIQIALASDQNCFQGLLVAVASIIQHCSPNTNLNFTILDGGICDRDYEQLKTITSQLNSSVTVRFNRHPVGIDSFSKFPPLNGNYMTYARFLLPDILPDCDFVVYSDCDILWNMDIVHFWEFRNTHCGIIASCDMDAGTRKKESVWFNSHNIAINSDHYFCAGLAILNLKYFRDNCIVSKCVDFLTSHPDALYNDQTALNATIKDVDKKMLPEGLQVFSMDVTDSDFKRPFILHYAGDAPWAKKYASDLLSDVAMIWFRYYASIKQKTTWAALREFYTPPQIVLKRGISKFITSSKIARFLILDIVAKFLKPGLSEYLDKRIRKLKPSSITQ